MTREDRDKILKYLTEQTNADVTDCRLRIANENGVIAGLQMAAAQIAQYVRGLAESEDRHEFS
jgi:hypothetical protein